MIYIIITCVYIMIGAGSATAVAEDGGDMTSQLLALVFWPVAFGYMIMDHLLNE